MAMGPVAKLNVRPMSRAEMRERRKLPEEVPPPRGFPEHGGEPERGETGRFALRCACGWFTADHGSELAAKIALYMHMDDRGVP